MRFGISESHYKILDELVIQALKNSGAQVFIFGSRAREDHHPHSDVDILYVNTDHKSPIGPSLIGEIREKIEESRFPYAVEIVNDCDLAKSYRESVDADKIKL